MSRLFCIGLRTIVFSPVILPYKYFLLYLVNLKNKLLTKHKENKQKESSKREVKRVSKGDKQDKNSTLRLSYVNVALQCEHLKQPLW